MTNNAMPTLPTTITLDYQPYGRVTLGDLRWDVESARDWNRGGNARVEHTVLRGTVIDGSERGYLFGHVSSRNVKGETRTIYGVREDEIARGNIVRVAA